MDSASGKWSVKLPIFDGTEKKFQMWWIRFKAYATVHKFRQALDVGGETYMPLSEDEAIDETTEDGKKEVKAKARNAVAMANLTMAFTSEGTMKLVYKAMTSDWPSGLAHKVVEKLLKKYQPKDTISQVDMRQKLNSIKCERMKTHSPFLSS